MDLSLLPKSHVLWLNTMKTKNRFTSKKPPIIITVFSKPVTISIILHFCGRITTAIFTMNALNTLWDATLSKSPTALYVQYCFSYSQNSNFDNAHYYIPAVFPDSFSSSPWLSCPMSPVPLSPFCTKAFLSHMDETNPTLHYTWQGTACSSCNLQWGKHWKSRESSAPSSSSPSHLRPCLTSPQSRLPQWSQKVGLM